MKTTISSTILDLQKTPTQISNIVHQTKAKDPSRLLYTPEIINAILDRIGYTISAEEMNRMYYVLETADYESLHEYENNSIENIHRVIKDNDERTSYALSGDGRNERMFCVLPNEIIKKETNEVVPFNLEFLEEMKYLRLDIDSPYYQPLIKKIWGDDLCITMRLDMIPSQNKDGNNMSRLISELKISANFILGQFIQALLYLHSHTDKNIKGREDQSLRIDHIPMGKYDTLEQFTKNRTMMKIGLAYDLQFSQAQE